MPRLFVGIDFPAEAKHLLSELGTGMPEVRWVEPEKFHLTLRFIGDVDDAIESQIATALRRVEASAFALTLAGVGHFSEHTLWVGVEQNADLMSLQAKIERAMRELALPAEPRPFIPHVKLARLKRSSGLRAFLLDHGDFRINPFAVRQFSLIESVRNNSRTIYAHRADYPLFLATHTPQASSIAPHAELFAHGADIGIRGVGPTPASAFEQAAMALTMAVTDPAEVIPRVAIEITCEAPDDELLLVDWLNALIFEMSARRLIFSRFVVSITGQRLRGQAWGEPIDQARHKPAAEPKGATFTEVMAAARADGAWVAQCVVDV